jgi:hypothetical protein
LLLLLLATATALALLPGALLACMLLH